MSDTLNTDFTGSIAGGLVMAYAACKPGFTKMSGNPVAISWAERVLQSNGVTVTREPRRDDKQNLIVKRDVDGKTRTARIYACGGRRPDTVTISSVAAAVRTLGFQL